MHAEAHAGLGWAIDQSLLDRHAPLRILDVGGQDVNGTAHDWFTHPATTITTLDIEHAEIIADARTWEPDRLFDVVMATEVFEHIEDWRAVLATMRRALDPAGPGVLLATCASTGRKPHGATGAEHPADGEWYHNVPVVALAAQLGALFADHDVQYQAWPGDAYMWARTNPPADITVLIATIPTRAAMLTEALDSVRAQTLRPRAVIVETDTTRAGAAATRNRALEKVETTWTAFLDDDDLLYPQHLQQLLARAEATGADLIYPWFDLEWLRRVDNTRIPLRLFGEDVLGQPFTAAAAEVILTQGNFVPITVLARTELLRAVGGFPEPGTPAWPHRDCEDWGLWQALLRAGARFEHLPERTWRWRMWGGNQSGRPR